MPAERGDGLAALRRQIADLAAEDGSTEPSDLLRSVVRNVPDFIATITIDGHFLYLNRIAPGLGIDDVVGTSVYDYLAPGSHEVARECFAAVARTGEPGSYESTGLGPHGQTAHYMTRVGPVHGPDGKVLALTLVASDVTAMKKAELALRESEQKLRVAILATGMGLWTFDVHSGAITWDETVREIFGIDENTAPMTLTDALPFIHPEDREEVLAEIERATSLGTEQHFTFRIVRPDGSVRWVLTTHRALERQDGTVERILGGILDVTAQRALEDRIRQAQKTEALGQLTAGVAHNFNNMLAAIVPNLEMALVSAPAQTEALLLEAKEAAHRAAEMVRQLMTFAGRLREVPKRPVRIGEVVDATLAICRRTFDRRIRLSVGIPAEELVVVADPNQLEQALLNIVLNARDAVAMEDEPLVRITVGSTTAEDPRLKARGQPGGSYVWLQIDDNGVGMEPDTVVRASEPFFTTKAARGTGLGLATTVAIIEAHGGFVHVESQLGEGTTVMVYLPRVEAPAVEDERFVEAGGGAGSEIVLVVDDEDLVRASLERILEQAGYEVRSARDGDAALALLSVDDIPADVVILDVSMPGLAGRRLVEALRERLPGLPIVLFSGLPVDETLTAMAQAAMPKPATTHELLTTLRSILDDNDPQGGHVV